MSVDAVPEPTIFARLGKDACELRALGPGTIALFCGRSPDKETDNEDAAAVIAVGDRRAILAVADGVGSQPSGATAAELAVRAVARGAAAAHADSDILRSAILNGFEEANHAVAGLGVGAATTLAAVEIDGPTARPYHVGDSMILVVGQRGKIKLQTVSHSPVGYAVEAGLLDESEAIHHEDRHLVSNLVGSPDMRIEIGSTLSLRPRDTVVLGSDGLFDNLHLEEIVEAVRKGPLSSAVKSLAETARHRMRQPQAALPSKPDDLTFLIYRPR